MTYSLKIIDSAFRGFLKENPESAFVDYLTLKSIGYGKRYQKSIMPLNQTDYFSPIYILYKVLNDKVIPIMIQRYVSRLACLGFNVPFPIESMILESKCKDTIGKYTEFTRDIMKNKGDLIYPGSFTTNPNFDYSAEEKKLFIELTCAFHYAEILKSPESSFVTTSVKRFKTYRILENAGHRLLNGLNSFRKESFYGEDVLLMGAERLSSRCRECFHKHENLFNDEVAEKLVA